MAVDPHADLHPDILPIAFLLGTWRGEGEGDYPTTEPFAFKEEMRFEHLKDAFLLYSQASWLSDDDSPLHFERGVLRAAGEARVEFALAHPLGVVEISEGTVKGTAIDVASTSVVRSATGSAVTALSRRYRIDGDELSYELDMATDSVPLTFHVRGTLRRDA